MVTNGVRLTDLLLSTQGPDAPKTGDVADFVRLGSTYWGKPGRPVHVITTEARPIGRGHNPTLCGRSTDAHWWFGPDNAVTCRTCAKRLAALRARWDGAGC